jgi:predicted RNA-binding Zn ribbon-like protein
VDEATTVPGRYRATLADGELRLVQALLNTAALPKDPVVSPDLLDAPGSAAAWLESVGVSPEIPGIRDLQNLRDAIRQALIQRDHEPDAEVPEIVIPTEISLGDRGTVRLDTDAGLRQRVLAAIYAAQLTGTWNRFKVCRNPECRVAFWDQSRNTSAAWHDSRTCGNLANLHSHRARKNAARL